MGAGKEGAQLGVGISWPEKALKGFVEEGNFDQVS